jgi:hypothetical protein
MADVQWQCKMPCWQLCRHSHAALQPTCAELLQRALLPLPREEFAFAGLWRQQSRPCSARCLRCLRHSTCRRRCCLWHACSRWFDGDGQAAVKAGRGLCSEDVLASLSYSAASTQLHALQLMYYNGEGQPGPHWIECHDYAALRSMQPSLTLPLGGRSWHACP